MQRTAVGRVVGIVRPLTVEELRELAVVHEGQHHVDVVARRFVEHVVELPRAVEPVRVVAETGVLPLDAERPRRHPDASEVRVLRSELTEPVVDCVGAALVVPACVLTDREVWTAVVEREHARVAFADPQEATIAPVRHAEALPRLHVDVARRADDPPPPPLTGTLGREPDPEARLTDGRQPLAAVDQAALVVLEPEAERLSLYAARAGELRPYIDLLGIERVGRCRRRHIGRLEP